MKLIYWKSALKCDSFDVAVDIKIQFFRVLVTIEPGRSLLQFVTTNCLILLYFYKSEKNFWGGGIQPFTLEWNKTLCYVTLRGKFNL